MSGFEVVGFILAAYPLLMTALEVYGEVRSGKGARRMLRHLKLEEAIFNNFIHHLLAPPTISEADLIRLTNPTRPDLELWRDLKLQEKLSARLGRENASIAVEILGEINELLRLLRNDLTTNDGGGKVRVLINNTTPRPSFTRLMCWPVDDPTTVLFKSPDREALSTPLQRPGASDQTEGL